MRKTGILRLRTVTPKAACVGNHVVGQGRLVVLSNATGPEKHGHALFGRYAGTAVVEVFAGVGPSSHYPFTPSALTLRRGVSRGPRNSVLWVGPRPALATGSRAPLESQRLLSPPQAPHSVRGDRRQAGAACSAVRAYPRSGRWSSASAKACSASTRTSSGGGSLGPASRSRAVPSANSSSLTQTHPSFSGPGVPTGRLT